MGDIFMFLHHDITSTIRQMHLRVSDQLRYVKETHRFSWINEMPPLRQEWFHFCDGRRLGLRENTVSPLLNSFIYLFWDLIISSCTAKWGYEMGFLLLLLIPCMLDLWARGRVIIHLVRRGKAQWQNVIQPVRYLFDELSCHETNFLPVRNRF
jgi:hypothetical protein